MKALIRQAEDILDVAVATRGEQSEFVILFGRDGGMRILDGTGWGLAGLLSEYGARAVYRIERRGRKVRVEGWSGVDRCLLEREMPHRLNYATTSHAIPLAIAGSNECSPRVLNSYLSI